MKAQLRYLAEPGRTHSFDLDEELTVIGSDPALEISIPVAGVAERHAHIRCDGASYWIEDAGAPGGVFVNGLPVERAKLRHLFVINLAGAVDLLFLLAREADDDLAPRLVRAVLYPLGSDLEPFEAPRGRATLGRGPDCSLRPVDPEISLRHARIERTATRLIVQDLGSTNGTWVNGQRVHRRPLRDGDLLSLAGVCNLRIDLEFGEPGSA